MPQPLQQRVETVRRGARRLVWLHGLCRFAAAAATTVVAAGVLDYVLRLHNPGGRWLLSAAALVVVGAALIKLVLPALAFRQSLVAVARRIESRYPQLRERLSSAMAFLGQSEHDPTAGSPALRRAVVAEAEAVAADLDFNAALDRRAPRQAVILALAALLMAGTLAALNPPLAGLALSRLAQPWRDQPWPRRHELAFVDPPQRLAVGDNLELELIDRRGELPDQVEIQLRHETTSGWRSETRPMKPLADRMVFRLDNVATSLAYRARGGDDDTMPWRELVVVEPPKVVGLDVRVTPPAYSRLAPRSEGRVVRALVGSQLAVRGRLDKPIHAAALKSDTPDLPLPPVEVAADGRSFTVPPAGQSWPVERSAALWFELTDEHGVAFGRDTRIELHAVADSPPSIAWESPADHTLVTPRAIVPIKGLVKDDLAIRGVQLRYLRPGSSEEEQVVELYSQVVGTLRVPSPDNGTRSEPTASSDGTRSVPTTSRGYEGETIPIDFAWDLSRLAGLAPGDVLAVRITAEDYKPQLATSIVRRLTIITEEELHNRVAQRQGAILSQLAEALRMSRQAREQTESIAIRLQETGELAAGDLNHLQAAQHNQRQVHEKLSPDDSGAQGQIAALLAELDANRVASQAIVERMNDLLSRVQVLNRQPLPQIDQQLNEAFKRAREAIDRLSETGDQQSAAAGAREVAQQLQSAGATQDDVIHELEAMLGNLAEWDSFSRLAREIGQIRGDQQRLADETEELRLKGLATIGSVPPIDRATGRQLAQRQLELARRLDKVQSRMEEMLVRLQDDPLAAGALADALGAARRLAIGGRMREAGARLAQHELGQARQIEQAALDGLDELVAMLSTRRDYELARTASALREAAAEVSELLRRSRTAQGEIEAAGAQRDSAARRRQLQRLTRELEELADRAAALSRRLQRLRAPRAAAALDQAAAKARAAAQAAAADHADDAQQQAAEAQQRLEEAEREVARAAAEAEQELAHEQMARVEQAIAALAARQTNVIAQTERIDSSRDSDQPLDAAQQAALRSIAAEQRLLADETDQLRPRMAAEAFSFALEGAAQQMRRAGGMLTRGETGAPAQEAERLALSRLEQILAALRPDEPSPMDAQPQDAPPDEQPMTPPPNMAAALAELKLLKLLQEEINRRTSELEARRADRGVPDAAEERELASLAREQGRLADMVLNLIEKTAAADLDPLEGLP